MMVLEVKKLAWREFASRCTGVGPGSRPVQLGCYTSCN
jgi:hypothetical protein